MVAVNDTSADEEGPVALSASATASSNAVSDTTQSTLQRRTPHIGSAVLDPDVPDTIALGSAMLAPLKLEKTEKLAINKSMTTKATLYRDGTLICDTLTECRDLYFGLTGILVIAVYDNAGHVLAKSDEMQCKTRGGLLDLFTPSSGRERHTLKFPEDIARRATTLDIRQNDDGRSGGDPVENLERLQGHMKAFVERMKAD